ncbi:hypothetical protein PITC_049330 [Penicillium italicum]|uniref:Uncharacterized protein n=1 Tax=Penicillium italicum TaxID=40296 RepID=A0A0A2K9I8_PENIT|nr:hypothetical protein PITC_049330 [Penicillium italicum]
MRDAEKAGQRENNASPSPPHSTKAIQNNGWNLNQPVVVFIEFAVMGADVFIHDHLPSTVVTN